MVPAKDKTSKFMAPALPESGMRAVSQCEQVADLAGHDLGALQPELEGALVDDHVEQPGHVGGPVRLEMGEQVPLLIDVASVEDTRRDRTEVALCLHQVRDKPEAMDPGERGLGLN